MNRRDSPKKRASNFTLAILSFLVALAALLGAVFALWGIKQGIEQQELRLLAISTANKITKVITDRIWKAETLATLIVQGHGEIEDFDKIAAILVNDPAVLNVSLAPGGVVRQIFPLHGNEAVIGLDYLNSGGASEARWARDTGKLTLAGPFTMVQGGQALTGRLPVYLEDGNFWGFVGIALAYPDVLESAFLDELFQQGFSGEIWRMNPADDSRQSIWHSHEDNAYLPTPETLESRAVNLFNVTWHVSVARLPGIYSSLEKLLILAAVLFFSLLVAMLCYHYLELRNMKTSMENMAMTDTLTGLPNRRNVMRQIESTIANTAHGGIPFVILYMDLNGFKQVNDTRGHDAGDNVLNQAADILRKEVGTQGTVARVGGDEFIIFLKNYTRSEKLDQLVKQLDRELQINVPATDDKEPILVTGSFGVSYYPEDGAELKTLLHAADLRMYNTKKIKRDTAVLAGFKNHFR